MQPRPLAPRSWDGALHRRRFARVDATADRVLAVAVHDIEPATFERAALIRDWLADLGVDRVTLLVIPARDMHPLSDRRPEVGSWLLECERHGDAIAQHGFCHLQLRGSHWPRPLTTFGGESPEFVGLDQASTARAVDAGRRVLKLAGLEPHGFVAPAYAYTPHLRESLRTRFQWWAGGWALHPTRDGAPRRVCGPPIRLSPRGPLRRTLTPPLLRAASRLAGPTLRVDLHPSDLALPSHMLAIEDMLRRAGGQRRCVTFDDLAAAR